MKIKVLKEDIIEGLKKAANIIPIKTGAAFLRSIWLIAENNTLKIIATDANIEFLGEYPAIIEEPGLVGVQGRSFYDLLNKLPNEMLTFKIDGKTQQLVVEQSKRKYKLQINDSNWFKNVEAFPEESSFTWDGQSFKNVIERILYCISEEDTMEAAACFHLKSLSNSSEIEACGLNGHQFALVKNTNQVLNQKIPQTGLLLQRKYIHDLNKWLPDDDIECCISNKRLFIKSLDKYEVLSVPLSFYQFPDYHNFVDKVDKSEVFLTVSKDLLFDALNRILIFNSENNRCVFFDYSEGQLLLTSQAQDVGAASEILESTIEGTLPRIAFPTKNLIEIINHFSSEFIRFSFTGSEGPCGIQGQEDVGYYVILMPMKIVEEIYYSEEDA